MSTSPDAPTILVTVTGPDRPGVAAAVLGALARPRVEMLDLEQVVVRGNLTLAVLVTAGPDAEGAVAAVRDAGSALGMTVEAATGRGDNAPRRHGRLHVTVLAAPLLPAAVAAIAARLAERGANIDRIRRLSREPVTTVEFDVSGDDVVALRRELAAAAAEHGVDVAVSPAGLVRRGRRLVVLDVDSTLIQDEVIELLAAEAGRAAEVAAVTDRAMRGELDFAASLHERVACLAGLPASVLDDVRAAVRLTPGARTLCRTLRRLGFTLAVVSGGFAEVVAPLAAELDIQHVHANRLELRDGFLTGRVAGRSSTAPARPPRSGGSRTPKACRSPGRSRSVTARTTSTCWPRRGWGSPSTPSPSSERGRTPRSTCPISTPSCTCSASHAPRSRRRTPPTSSRHPLPFADQRACRAVQPRAGPRCVGHVRDDLHVVVGGEREGQRERDLVDLGEGGVRVRAVRRSRRSCRRSRVRRASGPGPAARPCAAAGRARTPRSVARWLAVALSVGITTSPWDTRAASPSGWWARKAADVRQLDLREVLGLLGPDDAAGEEVHPVLAGPLRRAQAARRRTTCAGRSPGECGCTRSEYDLEALDTAEAGRRLAAHEREQPPRPARS